MRNRNIEALRVISMFQIGILHALGHGGVLSFVKFGTVDYFVVYFIEALCMMSVNTFVLITGYFLVNAKYKFSRLIKLEIEVLTYSLLLVFFYCSFFGGELSLKDTVKYSTPISSGIYWFISAYAVLLIISPILNYSVKRMNQQQHRFVCILLITLFSGLTTVIPWSRGRLTDGYNYSWFIVLYYIAAYMRLYDWKVKKPITIYLSMALAMTLSRFAIGHLTEQLFNTPQGEGLLYTYSSVTCLVGATAVLSFFLFPKEYSFSKYVSPLGRYVLGAYLISDHMISRPIIWQMLDLTLLGTAKIWTLVGRSFFASFIILLLGSLIEFVRVIIMRASHIDKAAEALDCYSDTIDALFQ